MSRSMTNFSPLASVTVSSSVPELNTPSFGPPLKETEVARLVEGVGRAVDGDGLDVAAIGAEARQIAGRGRRNSRQQRRG